MSVLHDTYLTDHRALATTTANAVIRELQDRAEVIDAVYRFGLGQDLRDRALFASAFAPDAELDFQPAAARWGGRSPLMTGRDSIVDGILALFTGRIDTSHVVSNPRIRLNGATARLTAIVEAQHLRQGDHSQYALLKNLYAVELVRDADRWVIRRLRIDNLWYTGDPAAIFGG